MSHNRSGAGHGAKYGARPCGRSPDSTSSRRPRARTLGTSDWHEVTQKDVDTFADVTGDHQWIHVDVERAKETPFGGTIAHGYLTLSSAPRSTTRSSSSRASPSRSTTASTRSASRRRAGPRKVRASPKADGGHRRPGRRADALEVTLRARGRRQAGCVAETVVARLHRGLAAQTRTAGPASPRRPHAVRRRPRRAATRCTRPARRTPVAGRRRVQPAGRGWHLRPVGRGTAAAARSTAPRSTGRAGARAPADANAGGRGGRPAPPGRIARRLRLRCRST